MPDMKCTREKCPIPEMTKGATACTAHDCKHRTPPMPDIKEKLVELLADYYIATGVAPAKPGIADHLIANGVTIQQWISVEERLPEPGAEVLTYAKMPDVSWADISVAVYNPEIYQPGWKLVTHWMPLPEPPEVEA